MQFIIIRRNDIINIAKLRKVQNALARVVLNKPKYEHSTELLRSQWRKEMIIGV